MDIGLFIEDTLVPCSDDPLHLVKEFGFLIHGCSNRQNSGDGNKWNFFCLLRCA